jgi:hypothetical protein
MNQSIAPDLCSVALLLLGRLSSGDSFTGLLSATQAVMAEWHQPVRQDCESRVASLANPASNPDPFVAVVVGIPQPSAVANNRGVSTHWTPPR